MPLVYIKCPNTSDLVATNHIVADEASLTDSSRNIAVHCPYCGEVHFWNSTNGFFLSIADNNPSERFGSHIE